MTHPIHTNRFRECRWRRGFTLAEIVIAMAITGIIALAMANLASAVHSSNEYIQQQAALTQHGRVVLERIKRQIETAHASRDFPGFYILTTTVGSDSFPDTLVVWQPSTTAANMDGLPLVSELIVYAPNPAAPNELWEITESSDNTSAPAISLTAQWATLVNTLKASNTATRVVLTDKLRRGMVNLIDTDPRAVVRFEGNQYPSDTRLAAHAGGSADWEDLEWAQSIYSNQAGLRQSWCRIELQLIPRDHAAADGNDAADRSVPFFGSAAIYYDVEP